MNPLDQYPGVRKALYLIQWIANGIMGVLGIVFLNDSEPGVPSQFTLAGLILAFVWTFTGITAQTNTTAPTPDEGGATPLLVAVVGGVLGVLIALAAFRPMWAVLLGLLATAAVLIGAGPRWAGRLRQ